MKTVLIAIAAMVAFAAAESLRGSARAQFESYLSKFNKEYAVGSEEFETRLAYFAANLERIEEGNRVEREAGNSRAIFGLTKFTDRSPEEMARLRNYVRSDSAEAVEAVASSASRGIFSVPREVDWRQKGVVTAVKNQGNCGSCWAFSATEATESFWALSGKTLPTLAPQQVVSCDKVDGGCNGGDLPTAFNYIEGAGGIVPESDYPYTSGWTGITGQCKSYEKKDLTAPVKGYKKGTTHKNETELMLNVATIGPMAICVDASSWDNYNGGIVERHCGHQLDHCVQLVGYGTENNVDYWLVRNSWGEDWGEKGYIRIERDDGDLCGIAEEPYFPTF